jgi:type IV secretion system protein VirB10
LTREATDAIDILDLSAFYLRDKGREASSDSTGNAASAPVGAASSPGAPLNHPNDPGAALHACGEPQQLTPAQKDRRWLIEQHYKDLDGAVLADQSAHLAKTSAGSVGMLSGIQSQAAAPSRADALRNLTALAATPQGAADPNLQKALAALQGASSMAGKPRARRPRTRRSWTDRSTRRPMAISTRRRNRPSATMNCFPAPSSLQSC